MDSNNSREDNDIVCKHCKHVTKCYKCTEKLELVMELTSLLRTNDELIERLARSMKMTKEEMIHGLDKHDNRMASGKDTTNEVLDPVKLSSSSDKELIEIEERSEEYDGETKSPELHNEPRFGNVLGNYKNAYTQKYVLEQVQRQQHLLQNEQQLPSQYTPEKQNKEGIDSSSKAQISTSPKYFHRDFASLPPSRHINQYSSQVDLPTFHDFLQNHHQYQSGIKRPLSSPSSTHVRAGSPLQDIGLLEDGDSHSSEFPEYAVKPMAYQQSNLKHLHQLQQTRNPSFSIGPLTSFQRLTRSPSPLGLGVVQPTVNLPYEQEFGSDVRATFLDRKHSNGNMTDVTIHEDQFKDSSIDADTVKPSDRQGYDGRLNYVQKKSNNICDFCGKGYTTTSYLNKHVQTIHFGDRPYKCVFCFKGCSSSSNLKTHMRIHTGERPFQCAICFRCFNTSSSLKMHMQKH